MTVNNENNGFEPSDELETDSQTEKEKLKSSDPFSSFVTCEECSGKGTILVDSGNSFAGGRPDPDLLNRAVRCPRCHGLGKAFPGPKKVTKSAFDFANLKLPLTIVTVDSAPAPTPKPTKRWWQFWKR